MILLLILLMIICGGALALLRPDTAPAKYKLPAQPMVFNQISNTYESRKTSAAIRAATPHFHTNAPERIRSVFSSSRRKSAIRNLHHLLMDASEEVPGSNVEISMLERSALADYKQVSSLLAGPLKVVCMLVIVVCLLCFHFFRRLTTP